MRCLPGSADRSAGCRAMWTLLKRPTALCKGRLYSPVEVGGLVTCRGRPPQQASGRHNGRHPERTQWVGWLLASASSEPPSCRRREGRVSSLPSWRAGERRWYAPTRGRARGRSRRRRQASTPMPSSCAALGRLRHAHASPRADAYGRSNGGGFPGDLGSSTVHNLSASPPRPSRTVASWVTFVS